MRRRHRRLDFTGSVHFVTAVTSARGHWFIHNDICRKGLLLFEKYRIKNHVTCLGYVLMPDHLHALLYQDEERSSVSGLMSDFKRETSKQLRLPEYRASSLWIERYDDVPVPGSEAVVTKLEYMLGNPVRAGLADRLCDYPWSSARDHFEIEEGIVTVERI